MAPAAVSDMATEKVRGCRSGDVSERGLVGETPPAVVIERDRAGPPLFTLRDDVRGRGQCSD